MNKVYSSESLIDKCNEKAKTDSSVPLFGNIFILVVAGSCSPKFWFVFQAAKNSKQYKSHGDSFGFTLTPMILEIIPGSLKGL